uniref:Other 1 protein kinase n=1 Tax=Moniliophthora roreri TaxID=221103 RepID=A0A0W0FCW4_MONRR
MALEIWMGHYLFRPERPKNEILRGSAFLSMLEGMDARQGTSAPVRYNYLHDLESLFWILMYFLLIMHPADDQVGTNGEAGADGKVGTDGEVNAGNNVNELVISHRMHTFHELFPSFSNFDFSRRVEFLKGNEYVQSQYMSSVPGQFVVTMRFAIVVSSLLRVEYQRVEALPDSATDKFSATLYQELQLSAATLAGSEEKRFWLGDMFDMSEHVVPVVERTIQEVGGVSKKRAAEQVTGGSSTREGKRSKQSEK